MDERICESCGMPMKTPADFGGGDPENRYCVHCTDADGHLKPYEVKVKELAAFIALRTGATEEDARRTAVENLSTMPAWKGRAAQ